MSHVCPQPAKQGCPQPPRYRERARKHVTELGLVEELLRSSAEQLETLEAQRAEYWTSLAESYRVLVEIWVTVSLGGRAATA